MADETRDDKLTDRQEQFISHYLSGDTRFNATRAAIAAGYSAHTATEQGCRLLKHEKVRGRIDEYLKAGALTPEEILAELKAVALAPTTHFMQVLQAEYTDDKGVTHKAIIRQDYTAKINALKLLGQACGMFTQQVDVNVQHTRTIVGISIEEVTGRTIDSTATEVDDEEA